MRVFSRNIFFKLGADFLAEKYFAKTWKDCLSTIKLFWSLVRFAAVFLGLMKGFVLNLSLLLLFAVFMASCKKASFTNSPDAVLTTSIDTLQFDTVFTSAGSVTQSFKIFNLKSEGIKI